MRLLNETHECAAHKNTLGYGAGPKERAPRRHPAGQVKNYLHYLTPFARHRFLNNQQIAAFSGRSFLSTVDALHVLRSEPNLYLKICDEQNNNRRYYQSSLSYFELTKKGEKELAARGISFIARATSRSFDHEVMVSEISSSLDIGSAGRDDVGIMWWTASVSIRKYRRRPKRMKNPFALPVRLNGKDTNVHPDYSPLVIHRKNNKNRRTSSCRASKRTPTARALKQRPQGRERFKITSRAICTSSPTGPIRSSSARTTCYPLFVFSSPGRRDGAIELLNRVPGAKDYARFFLFKWMPTFKFGTPAPATGHILLEPCIRGNGKEFTRRIGG